MLKSSPVELNCVFNCRFPQSNDLDSPNKATAVHNQPSHFTAWRLFVSRVSRFFEIARVRWPLNPHQTDATERVWFLSVVGFRDS